MALVTASKLVELTKVGLGQIYQDEIGAPGQNYQSLFKVEDSKKAIEEFIRMAGFGAVPQWDSDGTSINYDEPLIGDRYYWTHTDYALAWVLTHKIIRDDLYAKTGKTLATAAALSTRHTIEQTAINVFNKGFAATGSVGYDGVYFFSASHPRLDGGTADNLLNNVALSESSLEAALIKIRKAVNERGQPVMYHPTTLLIPPELEYTAKRILKQDTIATYNNPTAVTATGNNVVARPNVLNGEISEIIVSPYLTSTTAYFIGCAPNERYTQFYWREKPFYDADYDFDTKGVANSVCFAFSCGYTNYKGWFGSAGA